MYMSQNEMFSIRQMIELTGLSEFTIRGWENRYSAFKPLRSETGRREYTKSDIERALLLRELLKRGHKISKIATLKNHKLQELFEQTEEKRHLEKSSIQTDSLVSEAVEMMALQKWTELSFLLKNISSKNTCQMILEFFLPLLSELANQVEAGLVSIAQEHVLSSFLKERIYSALSELDKKKSPPKAAKNIRFVLATPEGDYHEIGLLLAHLLIRSHGITSLYLGPHTPAKDLAETALRFEATHLLIVSTVSKKQGAHQELLSFVSDVQKKVGSHLQILLAGSQSPHIPQEKKSTLVSLGHFFEFDTYLKSLGGKT